VYISLQDYTVILHNLHALLVLLKTCTKLDIIRENLTSVGVLLCLIRKIISFSEAVTKACFSYILIGICT